MAINKWNFNGELQENGQRIIYKIEDTDETGISYAKSEQEKASLTWEISEGKAKAILILPYDKPLSDFENLVKVNEELLNTQINNLLLRVKKLEEEIKELKK